MSVTNTIPVIKIIFERIWLTLFAHPSLSRWNQYLMNLAQKNLGINNYISDQISGEFFWANYVLKNHNIEIVFDIGAHKGEYARMFRNVGYQKYLYLFEPHPKTFAFLKNKIQDAKQTYLFNFGFSDIRNTSLIFDYDAIDSNVGSEHASLYSDVITDLHGASTTSEMEVLLRTLDDFTEEVQIDRISLLKIATEGNEFLILKGARRLLEEDKIDLIQFEFGEMNVVSRYYFKDFFDLLSPKYNLYRLLPNGLLPIEKYNARHHEVFIYQNIVCIHRSLQMRR